MKNFEKKIILGVGFTVASEEEILEFITKGLLKQTEKYYVVTPNPELLVIANNNREYKGILNSAKLALPDGVGVLLGGYLLNKPLMGRITGVDLVESLCKRVSKQPITVGFLGAGPNIAVKTAECLRKKYPKLRVKYAVQEPNDDIKNTPVDILFVAFGSPKQEIWINENLNRLPVKIAIGVGGAFDFISGKVTRAPQFVRQIGFEWLFRLFTQPWRIKRQLSLLTFIVLLLEDKFFHNTQNLPNR